MKQAKGFTLIEFMIVVAIIGILAAVANDAFQEHQKRKAENVDGTLLSKVEAGIRAAGKDSCDIGIDSIIKPSEIAEFLKRHGSEFTAVPSGQGVLIHRKSCDK